MLAILGLLLSVLASCDGGESDSAIAEWEAQMPQVDVTQTWRADRPTQGQNAADAYDRALKAIEHMKRDLGDAYRNWDELTQRQKRQLIERIPDEFHGEMRAATAMGNYVCVRTREHIMAEVDDLYATGARVSVERDDNPLRAHEGLLAILQVLARHASQQEQYEKAYQYLAQAFTLNNRHARQDGALATIKAARVHGDLVELTKGIAERAGDPPAYLREASDALDWRKVSRDAILYDGWLLVWLYRSSELSALLRNVKEFDGSYASPRNSVASVLTVYRYAVDNWDRNDDMKSYRQVRDWARIALEKVDPEEPMFETSAYQIVWMLSDFTSVYGEGAITESCG
jgi:tetratricopeptide (TPR) repeat protein